MPWNIVTPSASALTYTDRTFGFTFQYPDNWQLEKPNGPNSPSLPEGTELTIRNYDAELRKGPAPSDALTIQLTLSAEGDKYGSADNWLVQQKQRDVPTAAVKYSPEEHIMVGDTPALRFAVTAPTVPAGNQLIVWTRGKWLYVLSALPASSTSISILSRMIASFKFA